MLSLIPVQQGVSVGACQRPAQTYPCIHVAFTTTEAQPNRRIEETNLPAGHVVFYCIGDNWFLSAFDFG